MNKIRQWLKRRKKKSSDEAAGLQLRPKRNPYLPCIRNVLQQILNQRGLTYGTMRLLVIDTDMERRSLLDMDDAERISLPDGDDAERISLLDGDDVELALEQLAEELNFLTILTRRPEYFQKYVETMYEENGLLVHVEAKSGKRNFNANTVLDFEQTGGLWDLELSEPSIYLPIYKKSWETAENLDICVPIGYNTVIVKGIKKEEGCYNRYGKEKYLDL